VAAAAAREAAGALWPGAAVEVAGGAGACAVGGAVLQALTSIATASGIHATRRIKSL
jgi:hypothetical protein